jgi:hypothetical protein
MWFNFNNKNNDSSSDEQEAENVEKSTISDAKTTVKIFKNRNNNDPIREKVKLLMRTVLPEKAYTSHDVDSIMFHDKRGKWYDAEDVDEALDRLKYSLEWWENKYLHDEDNTAIITGSISKISSKQADITNVNGNNTNANVVDNGENKPSTTTVKLNPFITRLG